MDTIASLLKTVPSFAWGILAIFLILLLVWQASERSKFYALLTRYDMPGLGKLAALARGDQRAGGSKWYRGERELCADFHRFHPDQITSIGYERATSYLSKAQELGRRELPLLGWLVVFVLLIGEALSFGLLLAGYIAQNASLHQQTWLGYLAATILAIILLGLTHTAGKQLQMNSLIGKAREWFRGRPAEEQGKALRPMAGVSLQNNELDDDAPIYVQLAGRVIDHSGGRFRPVYVWPLIALVVVLGMGGLSFYIRAELYKQIDTHVVLGDDDSGGAATSASDASKDINVLLSQATAQADKSGQRDIDAARARAAIAAFGALALLFFAMQVIGVSIGYFFGFTGRESKAAAEIRGPFRTAEEFMEFHRSHRDFVARHAQARLEKLQRKLRSETNDANFDQNAAERTFRGYVLEQMKSRAEEENEVSRAARMTPVPGPPASVETHAAGNDADIRRRIEAEVEQKLKAVQMEAKLRAEIEAQLRAKLGMEKS